MTATALIIDDEADIRELIALTVSRMGLEFHTAANLDEARNLLSAYSFDLCLTDMRLPDGNGVEFVRYIQSTQPNLPVAVITAHGNMEAAIAAMKNGAYDFVSKPVDINQLRQLVTQAVAMSSKAANESNNPPASHTPHQQPSSNLPPVNDSEDIQTPESFLAPLSLASLSKRTATTAGDTASVANESPGKGTQLIGQSPSIQELQSLITKVSRTNAPIWITGESGTGKELIARLIHERGPRSEHPFVAVNCGAIPSNLMESELFGHKKGSFTGATHDHEGLFMQANNGTLFLDEVAELPLHMQVKLLRAIQERSIRPVGGRTESLINVRILSASHIDLADEVDAGRFRHDLYYRLNVISLTAPRLRDRCEDIPLLVAHLLSKLKNNDNGKCIYIDDDAIELLCQYDFPGNVRELENTLERASTMMDNNTITVSDIQLPKPIGVTTSQQSLHATSDTVERSGRSSHDDEYHRIVQALNDTRWNRKAAAEKLGLTYRQLRYRIQQLGIDKAS